MANKPWTRRELIIVINLYYRLPFGKLHRGNPEVIKLAALLGRTTNSISYKLNNFASFDPALQQRGIKGASNTSKLDRVIWDEFWQNLDELAFESEKLNAEMQHIPITELNDFPADILGIEGREREQLVKVRVNQNFFRRAVLASYNNTCCITSIQNPELLVAGHIRPWGLDSANRMNPSNGIALNGLHDKAFECGLITITPDYKVMVSSVLKKNPTNANTEFFLKYDNMPIVMPNKFLPDQEFLKYHNNERFQI